MVTNGKVRNIICFAVNVILNLQQPAASGHFQHNTAMLF